MKKIVWICNDKNIMFTVNWFEYIILERIFKKQKYKIITKTQTRGEKVHMVIVDEAVFISKKNLSKLQSQW